jgi:hypothetical protein
MIKINNKAGLAITALFIALALVGFGGGRVIGGWLLEKIVLREYRFPLLLSRPVSQVYDIYTLINSANPYSRLSGYYSLIDNGMIDETFLKDRFRREQDPAIKSAILWVLSFSGDTDSIMKFYASVFSASGDPMKRQILNLTKRLGNDYYLRFININRPDKKLLPVKGRDINSDFQL